MQATRVLLQQRQPLIRFLGRRSAPQHLDHAPKAHPQSSAELPESFAAYREQATQHGPLKTSQPSSSPLHSPSTTSPQQSEAVAVAAEHPHGAIGGRSARELGPIRIAKGEFRDRSELPTRFHRTPWSSAEIEAIESGGASMFA